MQNWSLKATITGCRDEDRFGPNLDEPFVTSRICHVTRLPRHTVIQSLLILGLLENNLILFLTDFESLCVMLTLLSSDAVVTLNEFTMIQNGSFWDQIKSIRYKIIDIFRLWTPWVQPWG
jgi:hypothetical protein